MIGQAKRLYQLNSLIHINSEPKSGCNIISITSGKGGTGKSFIACNIAYDMAKRGSKILLIDLDINLANQNVLFNISTRKTLYHYLTYNQDLEDIIYRHSDNLHLILGESGKLDHPKLDEHRVQILIAELRKLSNMYDMIIIDTASGIENGTLQVLLQSDEIILVTSPEPTSIMDAYVVFKMLKNNGSKIKKNVIINKCLEKKDAPEAFENLEKATKHFLKANINYLGEISFSEEAVRSIKNQIPLLQTENSCKIADQIKQISSKLKITTTG